MPLRSAEMLRETLNAAHQDPHREAPKLDPQALQGMLQAMMAKIARVNQVARERAEARTMDGETDGQTIRSRR